MTKLSNDAPDSAAAGASVAMTTRRQVFSTSDQFQTSCVAVDDEWLRCMAQCADEVVDTERRGLLRLRSV